MALFCKTGMPLGYDDGNNSQIQKVSSYSGSIQDCLFIDKDNLTNIWTNPNSDISSFNDRITGVRVRPGYRLQTYFKKDGNDIDTMEIYEASDSGHTVQLDGRMNDKIDSIRLTKVCSHPYWTWNDSCVPSNHENRNTTCGSNLSAHPQCKAWCEEDLTRCSKAITDYCNAIPIDTLKDENICRILRDDIKATKCEIDHHLFSTDACQTFCTNNKTKCLKSIQTYCANDMDQTCQNFCKDDNTEICTAAIKNHCFKNNNANMSSEYCKKAVTYKYDTSPFDNEMREYCNVLPQKLGSGTGIQKDLSKMAITTTPGQTASEIDNTLENPICACFDEKLIQKKFSNVKQADANTAFVTNPQCFLSNCKNDPKAYKKMDPRDGCKITMCIIDTDAINIVKSNGVTFENNCGPGSASIVNGGAGAGAGAGSGTPSTPTTTSTSTPTTTGNKDCKKTKCNKLLDQIKSSYFNYDDLNDDNKRIFVALICLIFFLLFFIIYMSSSD